MMPPKTLVMLMSCCKGRLVAKRHALLQSDDDMDMGGRGWEGANASYMLALQRHRC